MKQIIKLTESDLHRIIANSVNRALREGYHDKVSDEDDEKDDFFDPDGNPPRIKKSGKNKKRGAKLPFEMENTIRRAVIESLNRLIETDCAEVMQTGSGDAQKGTNPEAGQYTTAYGADDETKDRHPGFSVDGKAEWNKNENFSIMRRPMYNPKSGKKK